LAHEQQATDGDRYRAGSLQQGTAQQDGHVDGEDGAHDGPVPGRGECRQKLGVHDPQHVADDEKADDEKGDAAVHQELGPQGRG